ncbi:MAG: hypothetical protein EHM72_06475 [Calditrichaeota bacterium]|nr:MAG: hypothetical protein EHM72_06475 [Calditrichota bacterium]
MGIKTSDKLRDELDSSKTSMKPFFKENNPEYLQIRQINDDEYIGKVVKSGASFEDLNNILMNVKTMLKMICPKFFFADDAVKIMALSAMPSRNYY